MAEKLMGEYLDVYQGIQSEVESTTRFDGNSDLRTTYLGRVDIIKNSKFRAEDHSQYQTRIHNGKIVRWGRMSSIIRYRS